MDNKNLLIIFVLMCISGLIIYYLYLKPESFYVVGDATGSTTASTTASTTGSTTASTIGSTTASTIGSTTASTTASTIVQVPTVTCPQPTLNNVPVSVVSRFFGIGFNIYSINTSPQNISQNNLYLIEHIPIVHNNTLGSMYAISSGGQLTIKLRNNQDSTQWWKLISKVSNSKTYYIIKPFAENSAMDVALQYENGNLALRPYIAEQEFESQKWITSNVKVTRGIPVINYNPASMFTPEFDPYSSVDTIKTSSLDQQNSQQVSDVISTIKSNIQQYLTQISGSTENIPVISASSLGNKDMPLNINLNLGNVGNVGTNLDNLLSGSTKSGFANIDGTTTTTDVLSLLDKYENINNPNQQHVFLNTDLKTALNTNNGYKQFNLSDYTSNRVSSCNCTL